jgi:hypothetical protein
MLFVRKMKAIILNNTLLHELTTEFYEYPSGSNKREIMGLRGYPHMQALLFAVKMILQINNK